MSISPTKTSEKGIAFIRSHEGGQSPDGYYRAYMDPAGIWTIGVGHVIKQGEGHLKTQVLTPKQAEELLRQDLSGAEAAVRRYLKVPLSQNQFDALVSFAFNLGGGNLNPDVNTFVRRINAGESESSIRDAWAWWNKANGQVPPGLVRRRQEEADMFFYGSPVKYANKPVPKILVWLLGATVVFVSYQIGVSYYPQYSLSSLWQSLKTLISRKPA